MKRSTGSTATVSRERGGSETAFRVAFVHLVCPAYKLAMFQALAQMPSVSLTLIVGDRPLPGQAPAGEVGELPHRRVQNLFWRLAGLTFVWQRLGRALRPSDYDLVLLSDGLLHLSNYVTMIRCWMRGVPFGLYSHGYNYQAKGSMAGRLREALRAVIHRRCDVLIVYTEDGARHAVRASHVPGDRVFVAQNTLDVAKIAGRARSFSPEEIRERRRLLGAGNGDVLLVYIGRIVSRKNPSWVLEAVRVLRSRGVSARAAFVGDGDDAEELRTALEAEVDDVQNAIVFVGRLPLAEVDLCVSAADIVVVPGITGLACVHAAAIGRPFVTSEMPSHGPEIAYVEHGVTGLIAPGSCQGFCAAVASLATNPTARKEMGRLAQERALRDLTLERQLTGFLMAFDYIRSRGQVSGRERDANEI